jgi:AraC-like DNA-binding protein
MSTPVPTRTVAAHYVDAALFGARRRGVDTAPLLAAAGIPAEVLADPHARVPADRFGQLVRLLWGALDDETIGFGRVPTKPGTFAWMSMALVHARDLRSALQRAGSFYELFPAGPRIRLDERADDDLAVVEFDLADFDDPTRFATESLLVTWHRFASWLSGRRIELRAAELAYPPPPHALEYELVFGCACRFDAGRTALVVDRKILALPVLQDENSLRDFLRVAPEELMARRDYAGGTAAQVRRIVGQALPYEMPDLDAVAGRLSMSGSSLRRQLRTEGTSFQRIRDQLRRDVAVASLARGDLSIEALAAQLGFSEPSAFHRAFKRWTGATPRSYQART